MELRFPQSEIPRLATRYMNEMGERDRRLTTAIMEDVARYARKGFLTKEFLIVLAREPRSKPRCESNDEELIREVSHSPERPNRN